ncbi:MAG: ribonuclease H-like domain-containing protein [Myxococcales bacterium]|nr:ribonuclease H-like domain-containing protein [Myxococcales bacterium]
MRLRDKLSHLPAPGRPEPDPVPATELTHSEIDADTPGADRLQQLRGLIGQVVERDRRRQRHRAPAQGPLPLPFGERRDTDDGPLHLLERFLEPDHHHGRVAVAGALTIAPPLLARFALDPALSDVDLSRMLIFDTETTGLAGGTGTVPFLIGLAFFEDGVLKVEQLFLPNLGAEAPMLHHLSRRMAAASCIVSYNGKSFDWPLLRTRFIMARVPVEPPPPHLDLLHCARRVLKPRMQSVRLTEVERELLGFFREGDVDSALIPALYADYLRGADPESLLPIIEHNESDLVALAAVAARLCSHFAELRPADDPRDLLAYGRVALRAGDLERALEFSIFAADHSDDGELRCQALALAALAAARAKRHEHAAESWSRVLQHATDDLWSGRAHLELAKLYEHRLADPARAYGHARFTLELEGEQAHGRRLGRLTRRLLRTGA